MRDHSGCIRGYRQLSRAWYGLACLSKEGLVDQVTFGFYHPEGGTTGEIYVEWSPLVSDERPTPRLHLYDDAFSALAHFKDVLDRLADFDNADIQPWEFCQILRECGFQDLTDNRKPGAEDGRLEPINPGDIARVLTELSARGGADKKIAAVLASAVCAGDEPG